MPHNTKINCIFVNVEAGNRSDSFHNDDFLFHPQINKIGTLITKEIRKNVLPALFYSAGVKISGFLCKFAFQS